MKAKLFKETGENLVDEEKAQQGIYPTELIPPVSPYYLEPLQDL